MSIPDDVRLMDLLDQLQRSERPLDEALNVIIAQVQQAAVVEERQRLARELHDVVTQMLHTASWMAETLPRVWERDAAEGRHGLEELRQVLLEAVAQMRVLLLDLRLAATPEQRLGAALAQLSQAMIRQMGVPITLLIEEDHPLSPHILTALSRIAREALNNSARHAEASQITVHLCARPARVVLRISDNGRGFNPRIVPPGHLGLAIMQERAASIGAVVEVQSRPGQGTQIIATWVDTEKPPENG